MNISDDIKEMSYSKAIAELEKIVNAMQQPDCDIDRLADFTNRSLMLMEHCRSKLTATEEKINASLAGISSTL